MEDKLYKAWQSAGKYYDLPDYDTFKEDMKDEGKLHRFHESLGKYYNVPDYDTFKADMWGTAAEQQPTGQTGAAPAVQTTSAGEMVRQSAQQEQPTVKPSASQTRAQVKPAAVQKSAPVYNYTYFDESAIDPNEGELRMSMKPANWAYSERVNKSRGSHTKDNSPILRMSLDGGKLDVDVEREALADLKGMSDDEIYKYTNDLYNLAWGSLTNDQRREAASRLAAAGYELHVRDLGLGHAGDVDRNTDEVQTNLQDPKYRKLYDQGQWADPVDALSRQYDRLFAEQATGGTMGQQQATKMANRVLRAADKDQMFTWALQEAERTGGDPYKIYENIYDRFHAAVKDKLGAYNTRGQAAGLLGDIDAMIAEKWRAAEKADRSRDYNFWQTLADAENGGARIADRLMNDPDMWALQYAKRTIEGVNNMIAEADHNAASGNFGAWLESSFAGGVARGFGQSAFDVRTWDMGFGDVRDATALMTALDKSDKGLPLTKAEQAMLDAKAVELAANAYFKSQVGYGYEAGKVTGESLPFMLEMMINPASKTGGLAVNKLVRYALKRFPQRGAAAVERQAVRAAERHAVRSAERSVARSLKGKILESAGLIIETAGKKTAGGKAVRAAVKTAGNVAGSAVMAGTTGLPGVIADTENRMIGQLDYDTDESGKAHVTGHGFGVPMITAFKQALVARGIENVTEMSEFDVLSNWLGGLTRKALDKLHMSDVYKFFDDIRMSDVAKVVQDFEKNTHWQGTFGEYLEEVEGGILNAWLVGDQTLDQDPETGVFNVDNNVKTFLGVSLLGGAFSAVQTVGYRTPKARMRKDIEDADKQASELWGGTWQQFKNSVDGADDEEMEDLLANIVVNGNYSVDQRRAAAQYIKSVVTYRGAMKGEEIRAVDGESNPEDEQSYEQGYQVQGREREQVQDDLQRAEQRLDELDFDLSSFEGWTSDAFERRIASGEHDYTDEEIDAIREYFRAKAASDGMHQRVEDDIDTQVQQASDLVDKQTNQGTGMVHRATLNDGQEVYVTGGQLVMTGDGTMIDTEASDESLFVYNPATGQAEQYNPSDFQSVDDPVNPEQLKSEAARDIRQAAEQQAEADMNGYVQQGESYDMVDEQGNALHGTVLELRPDNTAVVQVDGEQIPLAVPTQQLQTWVDNAKQARMSVEPAALPTRGNEGQATDADTGRVDNATNETIEAPAVEPMVMDEQTGEPAWLQSTPERGYQYLTGESGLSGEDITSLIDDRIAQADAAIAKASKGGTIDQRLQARQAKDYWEGVKALHEAAKTAAQQRPTVQPTATGHAAPAGTVRVEANQAETMPVGYTAVNIDGTRADDRGQLGIRPEDEAYFLKTMNPRMMGLLNKVAKSLGWKIRLYNGANSQERGLYNDGVVWVNRRAMTSKLAQWILGHEMTHGMGSRTRRGETFKDYKAIATAYHRSQVGDEQYEREVASLIKAYQDHLRSLGMDTSVVTREYVEEEIACDVTGDLLMNNPEMIGKLFSGVESSSKLKRIIDMIVDALDWIKKKLTFRSEERQAFDDLIQRLNNLYRDAKAQTDIAKATAHEEGSQVESGEGEREGKSFSITGNAEGSGFAASETVLEIWRVPQEDGTYKEEEHWVKKPLLDSEGNVVFRMGDKEFSGKNPITVDDLKSNPDTVLNYMLADALKAGTIDEMKADQVRQQYADMLNLYLEKGMATEDGNGFENLEKKWLWVGETVFRTVASNSDEQYSYSMDITKVCKKNEAVIRAISAMQVKTGYGVTPAQILEIYETTDSEGFQVPCPVCYVFSRYINNGKYATAIVNGMKKYGKYLPGQAEAKPVEWWVKEMKDAQARAKKMETPLKNANDDVKVILQQIDALCREITSGKLSKEEAESKRRHVRALDQRYRAALDVISQEALPRWIKAFVIEGSDQGGWSLREDAALPEDMDDFTLHALDIRKTASAMEKYPALTRYRRAGGSAGGKEITFASNNELGTIVMGLGISKDKLDDYPNYYQLAAEAATDEERQALLQKARERFDKARLYAQRQTLRGGQRMWSWSDNIESLSSDVASNLMQLELLGGALQTYSKQLEGVKMVAAMNGYVNASLMGYGDGIREVGPDEIENGRLKDDIWDVNNKGRRRIIANAGSPVYHNEADGKDFVLVFDDVVGIDPFGHDGKRGLFSLNEEYDRAGNILVGMNDIHVRAAMADPRVFFIIPWHASGMSNHILQQMFNILGVDMDKFVSTDYTKMQEETNYLLKKDDGSPKKKVPKEVEDFWDSHTFEDEFACGTGHIENGDRQGGLSESQLHYRSLRDAIFDGAAKDNEDMMKEILADEFLSQVYRQVTTRVDDGKMTEKDKEFIYPYEYWDETSTVENADVNGRRYVEYCRRMGFKPKFTGKFDDKTGYSPEGNFADDPGYWKLLIDRRMYDRRGNYQDLTPVDSSGLDSSMYDPDQTSEEFNVTEVATNEGAEKIADIVYQRDAERTGSMPAPNLDMTMDEAVSRYKEVTALQASLIKAEREALTAADVAKQKVEKANTLKAQDTDGRKAKSVARAQESARKAMEVAKQKAREVDEIAGKFGDAGNAVAHGTARFSLSTEIAAKYPNWMDNQVVEDEGENKERGQNTQIPGTIGTYKKVADWIEKNLGKGVRVLDASSGLGRGTIELQQRGFNVEDIEPYPGKGRKQQPTYGGVDAYQRALDDGKEYDFIISNAVLNVIPDDWRRGVLHDMASLLSTGGKMFINTRKTSEVKNVKNKIELESPYELLVGTPDKITSYQRFFTPKELKEYVERELGDGYTVEIARPANSGTSGLAAVVVTKTGDSAPRFSIEQGAKLAPQYQKATYEEMASGLIPFNGKLRRGAESKFKVVDDEKKVFDNWYGTRQKRYKYNVGKEMGAGIYVHKDYAGDIVPADVLDKAKAIAEREGIEYKIVYYEPKKPNMVRLDEAPDFDTAREPIPGKWTWVDTETGDLGKTGNSKQIWHNKWMWVKDDYKGFDVDEAYEWSKTWNQEISKPDGWSYKWDYLLDQAGLPKDWTGSALAAEEPTNPDGPQGGKRFSIDSVVAEAEQMTETNPTDGQKESGNYKKGHVKVDGFDISIEQPKGSVRSGVDADGKEWSQEMHNTYGYIRGTEGVDGDHIDVFLSDHLDGWNGNVYVVDQVNKDRSFDEHKVMYGFNSEQEAREAYLSNYEEGWTGLGNITGVSREEFKKWVDSSHRKNKPFAEYKNVKPLQSTDETGARFSLKDDEERTLMGMHNITAEKLRSALKLGGLANPSMAVINTEVGGFTNFGEISLIPSSDLIASRTGGNAGTWGADAYSPRFPETHRRLGKGGDKKMRAWVKGLKMRQEMEYNTEEQFNDYYNGFNIRDNALVYPFLHEKGLSGEVDYYTHMNVDQRLEDDLREVNGDQWALLKRFDEDEEYKKKLTDIVVGDELRKINKKEGETFQEFRDRRREWAKQIRDGLTGEDGYINRNLAEDLLYAQARAYKENGKFSESRTRDNAEQYIRDHGMEDEYKQYFEQKMQELGAETQVYAGSDSQGRSRYKPVSLDQVSKQMKRQGRAGGEGGIFADSPGAIRAKLLTPMKTLDQIRAKKDRLVSHEAFEQFRERYQEEMREYADVYARGSMGALADIITSGNMAATAKRYNIDLDADAVAELNKFKNRVRSLPTEYFETKFERPVMLDEFKKAIVPDDLPLDLQGALQRAGLDVVEYKHGDNADRERVTLDAVKNDDSIRFSLSQRERDYTANVLKKLRKAGVNVQLATDEEAQRVLDAAEQADAELMRGWHGSSADFDAFDHSHMGEGEGAQAYGWGTYITEVEGIARQYAGGKPSAATIIKLSNSRRAVQVLDTQVQGMKKLLIENTRNLENTNRWIDEAKKELADFIKRFGADSDEVSDWHRQRDEQMEFWQDDADSYKRGIKSIKQRLPKYEKRLQEAKDELNNLEEKFNESGGRFLYEVSIPENNGSNYLPYDQVLSEETSKRLVDAIKPLYEETRANREKYIEEIAAIREPAQQKFGDDWLKSLPAESQERFEELIELQTSAQKKEADLRSVLVYIDAGDELLRWQSKLEKALGKKETSEFLSGLGYVGVEYPAMFRSGGREDGAKNYVIFNEGDAKIVNKTEFLKTSDGTVYGWHDNDGIHLTAAGLNPNTPMHEYTHGLMAMLKEREPEKYQQIVEALKDSEVWQEVLNDELYSNIRDDVDAVASEVASRLSGRESERRANESMPARIKRAIQELWDAVAEWFGVKSPMTADSIARMTLRELERGTNPDGDGPGGGTNGGDGPRFSLSGDGTVEEYNKAVNMTGRTFNVGGREVKPGITRYNFQEAFQDAILAVKKLQQVVERHFGIKLPTRENAWMYENRLSSINMHERKSFIDKVYEPMMKIADAIMKRGVKEKDLNAYLICKHGLERNQVFAMRDANEEANEIVRNGGTPDMQQLIDKYRQRDYSGLTGVTGIEGDITDIEAEAQRIVDEFEQRHGQLCDELWDAIRKATQWSLRKSYQSGMMSAATFDYVRNMFQYYIPLRGWSETTAEDVYSYMMGEHGAFNGVLKKAEGRTSVADDPLATIGNMAESALIQGNKNLLKQHLLRMAQNHPTDVCQVRDVWLVEGPGGVWEPHWPNIPDDATPDEIDQILQDHEADMQQLEASGQAKRVRNNLDIPYRIDPKHVPEHAVVAKVAGVDHVVYINGNPRAAQAINGQTGAGRGTKSGFSRLIDFIFGDVKRFYSSVLTSLNINFSGANFVRDLPHAYAMTFIKQGPLKAAEYIAKSFQVIPWVFKNQFGKTGTSQMDRYFQEFLSSGAVTGYAHINDVDAWKANNKRRFARLSALGKAKVAVPRALGEVINAIGWFSETLELIPRFTAFLTERQAGKDIATATKAAKDITTNFNKKGSEVTPGVWGAVANTLRYMKMFFNPIVQGMYQFVDVAGQSKENKWVGARMVLATMHLPVLGAIVPYLNQFLLEALGGDDDDDYWLINEYTRRNNVCIFTGNGYLKIPIAPVFRELYGMGEVVATRHAGKADNEKTTIDLIDQLRTMGSVEGQSSYNEWSLARFLLPEHFAPLIDVMNNENFTGGPIYYDNNYKEYAPEYTKAKKSTWSPLVAASKWLNEMMGGDEDIAAGNSGKWMNPAVWQHLITNVGGGFAQLAGDVVSGITDITEGKEIDTSNMPVVKRFYAKSSDERANWARFGIYKDFEKDYTMAKEKYQALDKRGLSLTERADEMVKFAESHPRAAAIYAVWEGGIKGADIPARLEKLGKDDPAYWDLVKEAVGKAEKAMNSGYVRAWEQKRKDRPDSMSDKELNERFDKSDNDSIRHIMADEISKRAGSQDYYGRDAQAAWSDKSVAAWEAYQDKRTSDDIKADAELSNLLKVDEDEKDKARIKMLKAIKDELNKIRRGKDATSRSAGVKGLGEGDDERIMNELRAARAQLIEDLKSGSAEQAYRNLELRTMRLGLRKKAKEL